MSNFFAKQVNLDEASDLDDSFAKLLLDSDAEEDENGKSQVVLDYNREETSLMCLIKWQVIVLM